jgi:hypothetical protein
LSIPSAPQQLKSPFFFFGAVAGAAGVAAAGCVDCAAGAVVAGLAAAGVAVAGAVSVLLGAVAVAVVDRGAASESDDKPLVAAPVPAAVAAATGKTAPRLVGNAGARAPLLSETA